MKSRKVRIVAIMRIFCFLLFLFFVTSTSSAKESTGIKKKKTSDSIELNQKKLILLSIDGFPFYYWKDERYRTNFPNLTKLFLKYGEPKSIFTVNPSVTYPAHTSMVTGKDPAEHGIWNNTLSDPFEKNDGGWMWYAEDILSPTLWDLSKEKKLTTANVFWPVTVGAKMNWNLPQYWRKKNPEDDKLLRVLSTPGLHTEVEKYVGISLNDTTGDEVKLKTAAYLFKTKKPNLMFVYTTDLDTYHHGYGPGSDIALQKLSEIDSYLGSFFEEIGMYSKNAPALLIVSDHGFFSAKSICSPNVILKEGGYIDEKKSTYSLTFKSSGGTAVLLGNGTNFSEDNIAKITSEITEKCPGVEWIPKGSALFSNRIHPEALGILRTKESIFISGTRKGEVFTQNGNPIHGHGYWNSMEEMKAIGFAYLPEYSSKKGIRNRRKTPTSFHSVKDVFTIVSEYLELN